MKLLKKGDGYTVYDAGAAKCVVFDDDRRHLLYRKAEAMKPEYAEYENGSQSND